MASKIIEKLEHDHAHDESIVGLADISKFSPDTQDSFKRISRQLEERFEKSVLKEFDTFRKGFEVEALEVTDKLNPIWKKMGLQQERSFLEALVQRAEKAVNECECIDLLIYNNAVSEATDGLMGFVADKMGKTIKNKTMTEVEIKNNIVAFSNDFSQVSKRISNCIRTFSKTCNCRKNVIK